MRNANIDETVRMTDPAPLTRRQRQAAQTRQEILQAARILFAQRGYRATTVRTIAEAAQVSLQTVYDSVGSKAALVASLNDLVDTEARIPELVAGAVSSGDTGLLLSLAARVTSSILRHSGDIVRLAMSAASDEPELRAAAAEGHRRHRAGAAGMVATLAATGVLSADADLELLADTVATLTDLRVAIIQMDEFGWDIDRVECWMTALVARTFRPAEAAFTLTEG